MTRSDLHLRKRLRSGMGKREKESKTEVGRPGAVQSAREIMLVSACGTAVEMERSGNLRDV